MVGTNECCAIDGEIYMTRFWETSTDCLIWGTLTVPRLVYISISEVHGFPVSISLPAFIASDIFNDWNSKWSGMASYYSLVFML